MKTSVKILRLVAENSEITLPELAASIGVTKRSIVCNIRSLQTNGRLRRIGPDKGGHWEIATAEVR